MVLSLHHCIIHYTGLSLESPSFKSHSSILVTPFTPSMFRNVCIHVVIQSNYSSHIKAAIGPNNILLDRLVLISFEFYQNSSGQTAENMTGVLQVQVNKVNPFTVTVILIPAAISLVHSWLMWAGNWWSSHKARLQSPLQLGFFTI